MSLDINTSVSVAVDFAPRKQWVDLDTKERRYSGKMSSTIRSDVARARVWHITTALIERSDGEALETILTTPGTVIASGSLIGTTLTCVALNVSRRDGPLQDLVTLGFELHEEVPA